MSMTSEIATASASRPTRPFYWSVRREVWEHRSIYIAPLIAAALVLLGFLIRIIHLPQTMKLLTQIKPDEQHLAVAIPFAIAAVAICVTGLIVAFFYCLGALYNERRDRSILFWKSLPVSNTTAVLSKAAIPFLVLPAILFTTIIAVHLIMLGVGSAALAATHMDAALLWSSWPFFKMTLVLIYGLAAMTLWYAPIYGWILCFKLGCEHGDPVGGVSSVRALSRREDSPRLALFEFASRLPSERLSEGSILFRSA